MKRFLLLLLLFPSTVIAHPVDLPCPQGGASCQEPHVHLGLNDPVFFECHRLYWHHRRVLNEVIRRYSECAGKVKFQHQLLGWAPPLLEQMVLTYWDVIPAHPVVDRAGDLPYCEAQLDAAVYTEELFGGWTSACEQYAALIEQIYFP